MADDDDDDEACPLCMQKLDETDISFFACPCNYQVCLFCVHYIMEQMNGKCPACRQDYAEAQFRYDASLGKCHKEKQANKRKGVQHKKDEKSKEEQEKDMRAKHAEKLKGKAGGRDLGNVRVVQRNVVHVIGLTANIAKADILRCPEFFGQYGKLLRVTVSKVPTQSKAAGTNQGVQVYSAYLTFEKPEDAHVAIQAVDGFAVDGHTLRANFGTTKYCRKFLDGERCDRKDCNFLHELAEEHSKDKGKSKEGKVQEKGKGKGSKDDHDDNTTVQEISSRKGRKGGGKESGKDGGKAGKRAAKGEKGEKNNGNIPAQKVEELDVEALAESVPAVESMPIVSPPPAESQAPAVSEPAASAAAPEIVIPIGAPPSVASQPWDLQKTGPVGSGGPVGAAPSRPITHSSVVEEKQPQLVAPLPSGPPPQGPPSIVAAPPLPAPPAAPPPQVSSQPKVATGGSTQPSVPPSQPPSMPPVQPPTQPPGQPPSQPPHAAPPHAAPTRPPPLGPPTGPPTRAPTQPPGMSAPPRAPAPTSPPPQAPEAVPTAPNQPASQVAGMPSSLAPASPPPAMPGSACATSAPQMPPPIGAPATGARGLTAPSAAPRSPARPAPPPLGTDGVDPPPGVAPLSSPASTKGKLSLVAALSPVGSGPTQTPLSQSSPLAPPPSGLAPDLLPGKAPAAPPSAPPSTPPSLPPSLPPSVPPSLPRSTPNQGEQQPAPQEQSHVRSMTAALAAAAGFEDVLHHDSAGRGLSVHSGAEEPPASHRPGQALDPRGPGLGVFAPVAPQGSQKPGPAATSSPQLRPSMPASNFSPQLQPSMPASNFSPQLQPSSGPNVPPAGMPLSVSDLFGNINNNAAKPPAEAAKESEKPLTAPAGIVGGPEAALAPGVLAAREAATREAILRSVGAAGYPHMQRAMHPGAAAAAAAAHATQLHAARLAAAAGDREAYDATRQAAYIDQLNWAAYIEQQRAAAAYAHYNSAYNPAAFASREAHAAALYAAAAEYASIAQAAGMGRQDFEHAQAAEAARASGPPVGQNPYAAFGLSPDRLDQSSVSSGHGKGRTSEAGSRMALSEKVPMPRPPGIAEPSEVQAGNCGGGKNEGIELLQSLLPNTRISVSQNGVGAALPRDAKAASAAATMAAGLRPGMVRGVPPPNGAPSSGPG